MSVMLFTETSDTHSMAYYAVNYPSLEHNGRYNLLNVSLLITV